MKNVIVVVLAVVTVSAAAIVWSETTPLPNGSWRHACAAANGFIYFLGGGSGPSADCYYARVNPDGTIGSWQSASALPTTLGWLAADATGGHIYAVGGWNLSGLTNAASYAPLDSSGAIGAWSSTTTLPTQLFTHNAVLVDSCFYVIGGCTGVGTPTVADVRFARIQPDGALGSWTETSDLPQPVRLMGVAAWDDYLYSVGGRGDFDAAYDAVYCAERNPDGTLEDWQATTSLPSALDGTTCAAVAGRLYACGGIDGNGGIVTSVYSAPINPDGTVGAWQAETSLPAERWAADGLALNDRIYVPGGYNGSGMPEVYYSSQLTGVAERPAAPALRLAATLCPGSVRFSLSAAGAAGITVIAPDGRVCLRRAYASLPAGEHRLDLPGLPAGAYLLRLETAAGTSTGRFVVVR